MNTRTGSQLTGYKNLRFWPVGRMEICNDETGGGTRRNYIGRTLRGRSRKAFEARITQREGRLVHWPSDAVHIWNLVAAMLTKLGYGADSATQALNEKNTQEALAS